jgi:hypothetical protein
MKSLGPIAVLAIGGGICSSGGSLALTKSALIDNTAIGGAGASGSTGGDGIGGGFALENNATATITKTSFEGNLAKGGAGGAGANGRRRHRWRHCRGGWWCLRHVISRPQ